MARTVRRKSKITTGTHRKCPKCGGVMLRGVCTKCKYSAKTAYKSRREAKESTYAAD
ncbi:MAG TPA: hypothetical protein VFF30_09990 [Nitrososphaerales archaeon]|nr:hypothetical protein [Nitrososphaerales archaeon]